MNSEVNQDHFDTHIYPFIYRKVTPGRSWTNRKQPAGHQLIGHFRKNPYFSEILETIRNTVQKTVCRYLFQVLRNFWQKLIA